MDRPARQDTTTAYRPDIDGLRAVAVLGVMVYHLQLPYISLPGGFTGVDVFFVISGFLITQILLKSRGQPGYLKTFYLRRFRRILPALLAVVGFCLVAGFLLLAPGDYEDLGRSARYALFALSNLFFYQNTGYFDQAAELMPLLHTWSLAVEEQFYLVWPLLLLVGARSRRGWSLLLLVGVVVASFAYSVDVVAREAKAGFYGPLARAWELGIGGLLAFAPRLRLPRLACEAVDVAGIGLIGCSFLMLNDQVSFPGANALFACLGSALIILPRTSLSTVGAVLSSKPLVAVGLISYSLYLWHWPLLVFFLHVSGGGLEAMDSAIIFVASFVVAGLSWKYVEQPFRRPPARARVAGSRGRAPLAVAAMLILSMGAAAITMSQGARDRLPEAALPLSDLDLMWMWEPEPRYSHPAFPAQVVFGAPWEAAQFRVVLWGDSHAAHLAPLVEAAVLESTVQTSVLLFRSCPANVDGQRAYSHRQDVAYNQKCAQDRAKMLGFLETSEPAVDSVILASSWVPMVRWLTPERDEVEGMRLWRSTLDDTLKAVAQRVPTTVLVGQVPGWDRNGLPCAFANLAGLYRSGCGSDATTLLTEEVDDAFFAVDSALEELAGRNPGVSAYLASAGLCDDRECLSRVDDEFLYRDRGHLRRNLPIAVRRKVAEHMNLEQILPPFDSQQGSPMVALEASR